MEDWIAREISRRTLLRRAGAGAFSLSAASLLAACGGGGLEGAPTDPSRQMKPIAKGPIGNRLNFSNWPLYIDVDEESGERPTLERFEREFGAQVKYTEEVNDNTEFYGKVRQQLARGDSGGRDLFVVTDWMAAKMKQLGWLQRLDRRELPNVERNLLTALKSPSFDPTREFAIPWQSGMVGIAYRRDKVGRDLKSVNDLFDPRFKGKVTMLTEMRDTVGLVMLGMGRDPRRQRAFCPFSQIDTLRTDPSVHEGQVYQFRIIGYKEGGRNLVVSRRALLEEEQRAGAAEIRRLIAAGAVLTGRVASVREFGAFVDLGAGVQGLLHVSEMGWSRVSDPSQVVKPGEEITVDGPPRRRRQAEDLPGVEEIARSRSVVGSLHKLRGWPGADRPRHPPRRFRGVRRARAGGGRPGACLHVPSDGTIQERWSKSVAPGTTGAFEI